jgi:hypothetical protein
MAGKTSKPIVDPLDPFERGLEAVRSLGHHTKKGVRSESEESTKEFLAQLFGVSKKHGEAAAAHNDTHESAKQANGHVEIFNATHHKSSEKAPVHADKAPQHKEAAIEYHGKFRNEIIHNREKASRTEMHEMKSNVDQIKAELSKLVASSEMLKLQFAEIGVEQTTKNIGTYHLNLFEWMLAVIRSARQKVEDSNAWLGTVKGKGNKKDYWGMFKKHGTTFGLSGERAVATSVG